MSGVYFFLNSNNMLGYTGRVFGVPESEANRLRRASVAKNKNPEDYIFESTTMQDAVPYNRVKHLIALT